jgi:F5/8 type C domain/Beta-propeller repeat
MRSHPADELDAFLSACWWPMPSALPQNLRVFVTAAAMMAGAFGVRHQSVGAASIPAGRQGFGALAPAFVTNTGQADRAARFVSIGGGRPVFFTAHDVRIVDVRHGRSVWLTFVDAEARRVEGESPTGRVTFLRGQAAAAGTDSIARAASRQIAYRDVVYRQLWPGIDARVSGIGGGLKYSFELAPHSDPRAIRFRYDGGDRIRIDRSGDLTIDAGGDSIVDRAPFAYQHAGGRTVPVDVRFVQHGSELSFSLGEYDRALPLVIDPTLVYSTYLGSSGYDAAHAIALDASGASYVAGTTRAPDFPTTPGSFQPTFRGGTSNIPSDAFVAKLNPTGTAFDYVTFLGGRGNDEAFGIAVDASGSAYVTGSTESDDFPATAGVFQRSIGISFHDGFLARLDNSGSSLVYATFFGTNGGTFPAAVTLDALGNAYVAGWTLAGNLFVTPGAHAWSRDGQGDGFLLKFDATGAHVTFGTYMGGTGADRATGVAVDGGGHAFVTGWTRPPNTGGFPTFSDAFIWKLNTNAGASPIMFDTTFGGSLDDFGVGVAVDPAGNPVVAVETRSTDFPTTAPGPFTSSVLARFSSDGAALTSSTYIGASQPSPAVATSVVVDRNYDAYVAGVSGSAGGAQGGWIERVNLSGAANATFTLQGQHSNVGPPMSIPAGIALGPATGDVLVTGTTNSYDFPTTLGSPQRFYGSGASDVFVSKVSFQDVSTPPRPNLALNKPVFVSSEFGPQYAGRFAVDGNASTRWSSEFCDPQWIYVDLEQTTAVAEVILRWETAYGAEYQVQMSNDAATWTTIRNISSGDGGVDDLTELSGSGRYLRILGTRRGTEWGYSLWELEVYGAPETPPLADLARHHTAVASSVAFGSSSYLAANAVDGDLSTRWSSEFSDDQWIYVDLTDVYDISEVILRWETAFGADYQVQVSDDASNWTTIGSVTNGDGGVDDLTGLSRAGRYVRVLGTRRGTPWGYSLWSLEVYGNFVRSSPGNDFALHHAVAASSEFESPQYDASKAVDGDPSTRWSSAFSDPQWIYVDLGQRFQINRVKLTWEAAYGADYQLEISNDAKNWVRIAAAQNNTLLTNDWGVGGIGRYVRMYGTRRGTEWGYSLWSFEVYGDPITDNTDLALNHPATSSSDFSSQYAAALAVDGDGATRWSSEFSDPQWIAVDLGQRTIVDEVRLTWETAYGADYEIQMSDDGINWFPVRTVTGGIGGVDDLVVGSTGRYVRVYGRRRGTQWGYSLWSFQAYGRPTP